MLQIQDKSLYVEFLPCDEQYVDFSACQSIPSEYHLWTMKSEEATDQEILQYAIASAEYAFLYEPGEDIYDCGDGQPL